MARNLGGAGAGEARLFVAALAFPTIFRFLNPFFTAFTSARGLEKRHRDPRTRRTRGRGRSPSPLLNPPPRRTYLGRCPRQLLQMPPQPISRGRQRRRQCCLFWKGLDGDGDGGRPAAATTAAETTTAREE